MDGKSKDLTREYIEQIKGLFPEAVTEVADKEGNSISHKVDMEKLAILLGEAAIPADETEYRQKYGEKFSFEWAGKRRAIAEAQKRSTGTLLPCPEESVDWDDTENLYIEGDNLEVLKLLQDSYLGAVKMIYIDPPYNTGKDFVYKDDYRDNLSNYIEMTNTTNAVNSEASGRYHTNWLNMIYPRLKLARNLLSDDGVIFISIDDNEVSNLKSICDEIFGEDCLVACSVWRSSDNSNNDAKQLSGDHNYTLIYSKCTNWQPAKQFDIEKQNHFKNPDNDPKGPYFDGNPLNSPNYRENLIYDIISPCGNIIKPPKNGWRWSKETLEEKMSTGEIRFNSDETNIKRRTYLCDMDGLPPSSLFIDLEKTGHNRQAKYELLKLMPEDVFDTPKPVKLITFLINLISGFEDGIVLDFFGGSGTTAHSVMQYNALSNTALKYIMVQLPENLIDSYSKASNDKKTILGNAIKLCETLNVKPLLTEIAKERIRRAGKKILEEQKAKNDGLFAEDASKLDIGFKVFKLDRSNVKEWDVEFDGLNEKQAAEALSLEFSKAMDILKDGRTELDLLYEVMLKLGLQLSTSVDTKQIEDKTVFVVGHGVMIASFAKGLTSAQIGKMVDLKADFIQASEFKVVLSDESFASDNDKTNAMQLFKQRGITNYEII
jgi:adenine-specific DNA-methyltransferase